MKEGKWRKTMFLCTLGQIFIARILLAKGKQWHKEPGVSGSYLPSSSALQQQEFGPWNWAIMLDLTAVTASLRLFLCSLTVPLCTQAAPYTSFPNLGRAGQQCSWYVPFSNILRSMYFHNDTKKSSELKMVRVWKGIWVKHNICWSCSYSSVDICLWPLLQIESCAMGSSGLK